MEELIELRSYIQQGNYAAALNLLGEMEEMSRDDKISKIFSYAEILLIHLIKKYAEKRSTRSWEASIRNSVYRIHYTNKRRKSGGFYLNTEDLKEVIQDAWSTALISASLETLEGQYDDEALALMVEETEIKKKALELILDMETA